MSSAPAPADYHGRAPDVHRYRCRTCAVTASTDNLTPGLVRLWRQAHDGHEVEEEHDVERPEPCTGMGAVWCPNCGNCSCPVIVDPDDGTVSQAMGDDDNCPLHGWAASHA